MFQEGKTSKHNLVRCEQTSKKYLSLSLLLNFIPVTQIELKSTELTHVTKCIHS